jgi:hypothetical protein
MDLGVGLEDHMAAAPAVAAVGTAEGHVFLAAKRGTPVAAIACLDLDPTFVEEHELLPQNEKGELDRAPLNPKKKRKSRLT